MVYKDFGFEELPISDRPEVRAGSDEVWDRAGAALRDATEKAGVPTSLNPGEGAFYGPKLEFVLRDAIGRDWQCGTLQVDFVLPERLDAHYIGEDDARHRPVILHRAILGSFERFIGILIENYAGRFPLWPAPLRSRGGDGHQRRRRPRETGFGGIEEGRVVRRNRSSQREDKLQIREHSHALTPVILVVGKREAEEGTVAIRRLGGKSQEILALDAAMDTLRAEAKSPGTGVVR